MRIATVLTGALAAGLLFSSGACVQKVEVRPMSSGSAVAPGLVLEQFLRAANAAAANDTAGIVVMGRLLGNKEGPVSQQWPRQEVQQRMFLTASILKHDDYKILGEQIVPGRLHEARQINVEMAMGPRRVTVPFTMVRSKADNWLIESVALENVTGKR
ncbi:MAG: hypothetical protein ACRENP_14360 [Longimicrobiales bacterium]